MGRMKASTAEAMEGLNLPINPGYSSLASNCCPGGEVGQGGREGDMTRQFKGFTGFLNMSLSQA